jgi:AAA+ ATPase superfamily predicted ATPase
VTGSKVGLLRDFLEEEDPNAYLYGRFNIVSGKSYAIHGGMRANVANS